MSEQPRMRPAPETPWVEPGPASAPTKDGDWLDTALNAAAEHRTAITVALTVIAALIALRLIAGMARRGKPTPAVTEGRMRRTLVYLAAGIGSAFTLTSMWRVFEHTLNITNPVVRLVLCGVFEIMMLASAVNSRAFRLKRADTNTPADRRDIDVDGIATWTFAAVAGLICWADSNNPVEAGMRGFLPLAVAWMWERAIAADLRSFTRTVRPRTIRLRISVESLLVFLRLADPSGRAVSEVEQARYRSTFSIAAFRLHTLRADNAATWRVEFARWRLRRAGIAILKRFGPAELTDAQSDVATLYGIERHTAPDAVTHLTPWSSPRVIDATVTDVTPPAVAKTAPAAVTPTVTATVTSADDTSVTAPVTDARTVSVTTRPSPTRPTSPTPRDATSTRDGDATNAIVIRPLSRDLIDAEYAAWTPAQVETYATERAQQVLDATGSKTEGMREYFLTCLALGVEPKGARMAKAVGAAESLGRTNATKWRGELAVSDAEQVLRDAYERVTAELTGRGDD